jgi:DME family drug/metabolite transporter
MGGAAVLLLVAMVRGKMKRPFTQQWPWKPTILAAASIAAYQLLFFSGVLKSGVAIGTMVGIGSVPIAGGLIGHFMRHEKLGRIWYTATALTLAGVTLLALSGGNLRVNGIGLLLAIGAGVAYAFYASFSIDVLIDGTGRDSETAVTIIFCTGSLMLIPILFLYDLHWLTEPRGALVAIHLGVISLAVAYSLFMRGLQHVSLSSAMTLTLAEPLTAGLLAVLLLGEKLTLTALLGIGLLFAGLALLATNKNDN